MLLDLLQLLQAAHQAGGDSGRHLGIAHGREGDGVPGQAAGKFFAVHIDFVIQAFQCQFPVIGVARSQGEPPLLLEQGEAVQVDARDTDFRGFKLAKGMAAG